MIAVPARFPAVGAGFRAGTAIIAGTSDYVVGEIRAALAAVTRTP